MQLLKGVCLQYNFLPQPRNRLRERFPLPGTVHDGRNTLSPEGFALLNGLLQLDPSRRLNAEEALNHRWCAAPPCLCASLNSLSFHWEGGLAEIMV